MTHPVNDEWVLLVDDGIENTILETVVDINYQSSTESGYTSEDALADDILGGSLDFEKAEEQSPTLVVPTYKYTLQHYLAALLVANVFILMTYVCLRGRVMLPYP